jgi:hypothetical protein
VTNCGQAVYSLGLCNKHYLKKRACGDPEHQSRRGSPPGNRSYSWRGDEIGYAAAHSRVYKTRGRASAYPCVDCGGVSRHWSYDHADPGERTDPTYKFPNAPYSTNPDRYHPRCGSCHKKFDHIRG